MSKLNISEIAANENYSSYSESDGESEEVEQITSKPGVEKEGKKDGKEKLEEMRKECKRKIEEIYNEFGEDASRETIKELKTCLNQEMNPRWTNDEGDVTISNLKDFITELQEKGIIETTPIAVDKDRCVWACIGSLDQLKKHVVKKNGGRGFVTVEYLANTEKLKQITL